MRLAVYFTPPAGSDLTRAAALWLGRDAFSDAPTRSPDAAIDPVVAEPARYGFHATMRAPFRLADGVAASDVAEALARFAATQAPIALPRLALARLGRFFALVPGEPSRELGALETAVREWFEPFRAPLSEAERARRRPETLSEAQRANLDRWGYPYVGEAFRFHMTLTGPVDEADAGDVEARLHERFGAFDGAPLAIDSLALFVEETAGAPFRAMEPVRFGV